MYCLASGTDPDDRIVERHLSGPSPPELTRYDLLLLILPMPYLLVVVAWTLLPVPFYVAVFVASAACLPILADALVRNPPVSPDGEE